MLWRGAAALKKAVLVLLSLLVTRLLRPVMVFALRSAVRNRAFWERGLGRAWYVKFQNSDVSGHRSFHYRKPESLNSEAPYSTP